MSQEGSEVKTKSKVEEVPLFILEDFLSIKRQTRALTTYHTRHYVMNGGSVEDKKSLQDWEQIITPLE